MPGGLVGDECQNLNYLFYNIYYSKKPCCLRITGISFISNNYPDGSSGDYWCAARIVINEKRCLIYFAREGRILQGFYPFDWQDYFQSNRGLKWGKHQLFSSENVIDS
jgi:hypothetical protein